MGGQVQSKQRQSIPKVQDQIIWLNVVDHDGIHYVVPGFEGESMLYTLKQASISISGGCGGGDQHIPETEDPVDNIRWGPACGDC